MRDRLAPLVLLASSLTFLVSLYLTWGAVVVGLPGNASTIFSAARYDGWGPFGDAAALVALVLVAGAGWSLVHPRHTTGLLLATCAFALLFFALANAGQLHATGLIQATYDHSRFQTRAGLYLGLATAALAFAAACAQSAELKRRPTLTALGGGVLTIGLLCAFLLPWLHLHVPRLQAFGAPSGYQLSSLGEGSVIFLTGLACFALPLWRGGVPPGRRLAAAAGIAVLTGGFLSTVGIDHHWPYEAWLALGCALGLLGLALGTTRGLRISPRPMFDIAVAVAASLLVLSLFLPWQKLCSQGGTCHTTNGWSTTGDSSAAGALAVLLLVLLLGSRRFFVELAVGASVYVLAAGFDITAFTLSHIGYGAPLGFAGAAMLVLAAARQFRIVPADSRRLLVRLAPMAACLAFLAIPVATLTGRLSLRLEFDSPWRLYWLEAAAILVALRLLGRWLIGPRADQQLVLLPLALLTLTALNLIAERTTGVSWEGWASVVLGAVLVAFGWIERTGGIEKFRLPEIWRIDRLPEAES